MSKRSVFARALPVLGAAGAALAYAGWVRPWMLRWGATPAEARGPLPGDALVPRPRTRFTRGITLAATPAQAWPWLVQMGCHRAGWYSYDTLDNAGRPSADRVLPELQTLAVGDEIWAAPDGTLAFAVAALEPPHALVLSGPLEQSLAADPAAPPLAGEPVRASWAWVLRPLPTPPGAPALTRLLVRLRADYPPNALSSLAGALLEPVSFLMERKTLLGIRARVEAGQAAGALPR
jgi:hypothetical protein